MICILILQDLFADISFIGGIILSIILSISITLFNSDKLFIKFILISIFSSFIKVKNIGKI